MKRFFQPIPKDGSPAKKRPAASADSGDDPAAAGAGGEEGSPGEEPRKFLTWNANSLLLRMKSDWPAFSQLVARLDPDVICVQGYDVSNSCNPNATIGRRLSQHHVKKNNILPGFRNTSLVICLIYIYIYITRILIELICQEVRMPAAGSKGAPKNPSELKDDTSSSRDEKQVSEHLQRLIFVAFAIRWANDKVVTIMLLDVVQVVLRALSSSPFKDYRVWWSLSDSKYAGTAMFIKKRFEPKKVSFNLDRTCKFEDDFGLSLHNYIFCCHSYTSLDHSSHEEIDVSHPDFFSSAKLNGYTPPNKEIQLNVEKGKKNESISFGYAKDFGQPGFTLAERRRFGNILSLFILSQNILDLKKESINLVKPEMSRKFKYYHAKNYLSAILAGFYGSDHCPVSLELSKAATEAPETPKPSG
ncbi:hypothetical protein BAE44_0016494 [Dichanthelium oligosanthes]|uniref:Uncharacterized protein n=1 Tax=Dichanthelium oligosanthes TaxID=888268 RepID=A0A1E5VBP3_9POAL|nr:hypothetical protein BAE44_0016494 [Dichanthelium oligosanthes]